MFREILFSLILIAFRYTINIKRQSTCYQSNSNAIKYRHVFNLLLFYTNREHIKFQSLEHIIIPLLKIKRYRMLTFLEYLNGSTSIILQKCNCR